MHIGSRLTAVLAVLPVFGLPAAEKPVPAPPAAIPKPAGPDLANLPEIIRDETAKDWVVDNFAGNSTTGVEFYEGPATEIGGLNGSPVTVRSDGTVYLASTPAGPAEIGSDGTLQTVRREESLGPGIFPDAREKAVYLIGGNSIRRFAKKTDGTLAGEVLAGTPGKDGNVDGPGKAALIGSDIRGSHRTRDGAIYWLEGWGGLRRFDNGTVSTVKLRFADPPDRFLLAMSGMMSPGEEDHLLLVADHWNFLIRHVDLKKLAVTNLAFSPNLGANVSLAPNAKTLFPGVRWERHGRNADGPALTHASSNSGASDARYDPFHRAVWVGGPDEQRLRWLRNGWVRTVIGGGSGWDLNGRGNPADKVELIWCHVAGFDDRGGVYLYAYSQPRNIWRAYNRTEATQ